MEQPRGRLELILGPMFSGKTSEMFRRIQRHAAAGRACGIVKYAHDDRYSAEHAASHDGRLMRATRARRLADASEDVTRWNVVGVDEGQFYGDLVEGVMRAVEAGKTVVVAALDGNYKREPFGDVPRLVPLADRVTKLCAVCSVCGRDAPFTRRLIRGGGGGESLEEVVIGGSETYMAVCRTCFTLPIAPDSPHAEAHARMAERIGTLEVAVPEAAE